MCINTLIELYAYALHTLILEGFTPEVTGDKHPSG